MLVPLLLLLALGLVPLARGRFRALAQLTLAKPILLWLAVGVQVLVLFVIPRSPHPALGVAHVASYVLAGSFLWFNRLIPGAGLLALGGALNGLVIAINGGTLPASASSLARAGLVQPTGRFLNSGVLTHPRLAALGDFFGTPAAFPAANVFSVGDVFILIGAAYGVHRVCQCWPWPQLVIGARAWSPTAGTPLPGVLPQARIERFASTITTLSAVLRVPDVRRLWIAQWLSEVGDWAGRLALGVLVLNRTHSTTLVTAVLAASYLPYLASPALTAYCQRFPKRNVLVGSDLVRACLFAVVLFPVPVPVLLAAAFVAALATGPFEAVRATAVADVSPPYLLGDALTLTQVTSQLALIGGGLVAGAILSTWGPVVAISLNVATFVLSALLLRSLVGGRARGEGDGVRGQMRAAIAAINSQPALRRAIALTLLVAPCTIVPEALTVVSARQLHSAAALGLLAAATPLGAIAAGLLVPRDGSPSRLLRAAAAMTLGACGAAAVIFLLADGLTAALLAYAGVGVAIAGSIPAYVVAMRVAPEHLRSTIFSLVQCGLMGGQAVGALIGGLMAQWGAMTACALALVPAMAYALHGVWHPVRRGSGARAQPRAFSAVG